MLDGHEWEAELSEWLEPFLDALGHRVRRMIFLIGSTLTLFA